MRKNIYIIPVILTLFSLSVIAISLQLDTSPEMIVGDSMQARSFPIFLMILKLILVGVLAFQFYKNTPEAVKLEKYHTWGSMFLFLLFYLLTAYTDLSLIHI